jgi:NDP-sugar pyrophosphorylase family protein
MVKIFGKPLLEYQIELAKRYGITEIYILSGYLADTIIDYFGSGAKWGVEIHHVVEPKPLGTAGALKLLEGKLTGRFIVFYGDIVMDFDIPAFIAFDGRDAGTIGTVLVHPTGHPHDSDLVAIDAAQYVTAFLPKPHDTAPVSQNLVNAAVYVLSPRILDYIAGDAFADFGKDIFPALLQKGEQIRAYRTSEYIKDMGTKERFAEVCADMESGKVRGGLR